MRLSMAFQLAAATLATPETTWEATLVCRAENVDKKQRDKLEAKMNASLSRFVDQLARGTAALSDLAEAALRLATAHLMRMAHESGELALPDPDDPALGCGFTVIGMGKLGARELNYSSDIDLILLYDPDAPVWTERTADYAMGSFTARVARVGSMSNITRRTGEKIASIGMTPMTRFSDSRSLDT